MTHYDIRERLRGIDGGTELGRRLRSETDAGGLLPDELILGLVDEDLEKLVEDGECGSEEHVFLLDGVPRTSRQAEQLSSRVEMLGVIELAVGDRTELVDRLLRRGIENGRADELDPSVVAERLRRFDRESGTLRERFERSSVRTVNADEEPLKVLEEVVRALKELVGNAREVERKSVL